MVYKPHTTKLVSLNNMFALAFKSRSNGYLKHIKSVNSYQPQVRIGLDTQVKIAFQPIVNLSEKSIYGYQALVRGPNNEVADTIFAQLTESNRYHVEKMIRQRSVLLAKEFKLQGMLSINRLPNSVVKPDVCKMPVIEDLAELSFPAERIIYEVNEREENVDHDHFKNIFGVYKKQGFTTAINNFGAGYSGLNRLVDCQPDVIKLDESLIRNIHNDRVKKSIVSGIIEICKELSIEIIADGIEIKEERDSLYSLGVKLFQGYFFAKPGLESLPVLREHCYK